MFFTVVLEVTRGGRGGFVLCDLHCCGHPHAEHKSGSFLSGFRNRWENWLKDIPEK